MSSGEANVSSRLCIVALLALMSACGRSGGGGGGPVFTELENFGLRFGDASVQKANAVATDSSGNTIIVGEFAGVVDFGGVPLSTTPPNKDIFVAKFDSQGKHLWSRAVGGSADDSAIDVAIDGNDDVYIVGQFASPQINFGGPGKELTRIGVSSNIFIVRLNGANGARIWSKSYGGAAASTRAVAIAIDPANNVIVGGTFSGGDVNLGNLTITHSGFSDVFAARYTGANGSHLFSRGFGDALDQQLADIATDSSGSIILFGAFQGTITFDTTSHTAVSTFPDIYLARLSPAGTHLASNSFGNTGTESAGGVATDSSDDIVIVGSFTNNIDFGLGVINAVATNDTNYFVAKFESDLTNLFSEGYGDGAPQTDIDVTIDAGDDIVIGASFVGSVDFGGGPLVSVDNRDLLLARLENTAGVEIDSVRFGDAGDQVLTGVAAVGSTRYVLTGFFDGTIDFGDGPITSLGGGDVFVGSIKP